MGRSLGNILGAISQNEVNQGRPMLSAIAVNTEKKTGKGFLPFAKKLGRLKDDSEDGAKRFWEAEKREIYQTWKQKFEKRKW